MDNNELKRIRLQLGLNQTELSRFLNTPYRTYVNWERGERRVPGIVEVALEAVRSKIEKKRRGEKGGSE